MDICDPQHGQEVELKVEHRASEDFKPEQVVKKTVPFAGKGIKTLIVKATDWEPQQNLPLQPLPVSQVLFPLHPLLIHHQLLYLLILWTSHFLLRLCK